ncbi:uncharacterized protein V1518DRAFT_411071 [Limtongia smithiae]|uniref:uncharacterized protein n=1 Tax=Limtongia smithiae TaxID=1125753 RepID=UPI0034CFB0A4
MGFSHSFTWPADPSIHEVYVTGTFDNWSKSAPLVQIVDGSWAVSIPLPSDQKIFYKYVVNDVWLTDPFAKIEVDADGVANNVLDLEDIATASAKSASFIPESAMPITPIASSEHPVEDAPAATLPADAIDVSEPVSGDPVVSNAAEPAPSATVMPTPAVLHTPFLGTPGIVIPKNASQIKELYEVRTTGKAPAEAEVDDFAVPTSEADPAEPTVAPAAAFFATPGPVIPVNAAEIKELQQPTAQADTSNSTADEPSTAATSPLPPIDAEPEAAEVTEIKPEAAVEPTTSEPAAVEPAAEPTADAPPCEPAKTGGMPMTLRTPKDSKKSKSFIDRQTGYYSDDNSEKVTEVPTPAEESADGSALTDIEAAAELLNADAEYGNLGEEDESELVGTPPALDTGNKVDWLQKMVRQLRALVFMAGIVLALGLRGYFQ